MALGSWHAGWQHPAMGHEASFTLHGTISYFRFWNIVKIAFTSVLRMVCKSAALERSWSIVGCQWKYRTSVHALVQSSEPLYSNTAIVTLAVDGWAVTFGTARRRLGLVQSPHRCTKCNSPPINGQCGLLTLYYLMWHYNYLCTLKG